MGGLGRTFLGHSVDCQVGGACTHAENILFSPFLDVLSMFWVYSHNCCRIFVRNTTRVSIF